MGKILRICGDDHDEATKKQLQNCLDAEEAALGVLCADGHLGYSMPIGGVVAYERFVSPSGVGYDIACGNYAVNTGILGTDLSQQEMERIADEIERRISFGIGRNNSERVEDAPVLERIANSGVDWQRALLQTAQNQLGTVGSGNHYVDILEDENGFLWIAVHFGSRGFGHKTASGFMNIAAGKKWDEWTHEGEMMSAPLLLSIDSESGIDYLEAMNIAGEYAYAGREVVVGTVLNILGVSKAKEEVHNHHNFTWQEIHSGKPYYVVRKGATPLFPHQLGFVGGSMGDISVILKGTDRRTDADTLHSTVHGAGRVMSRRKAKGKTRIISRWKCGDYRKCSYTAAKGGYHKTEGGPTPKCPLCGHKLRLEQMEQQLGPGLVNYVDESEKLKNRNIIVRGGGADEAPPVYRNLRSVLEAQGMLDNIVHTFNPRIVVMAGHDVYDPYKD